MDLNSDNIMTIPKLIPEKSEIIAKTIEQYVITKRMSYLDAVIYFCEQRNVEPQLIADRLGDKIRGELASEAAKLHYIPKSNELPF